MLLIDQTISSDIPLTLKNFGRVKKHPTLQSQYDLLISTYNQPTNGWKTNFDIDSIVRVLDECETDTVNQATQCVTKWLEAIHSTKHNSTIADDQPNTLERVKNYVNGLRLWYSQKI